MVAAVLFDLEGTLVNTDEIAQFRKRNWPAYAAGFPKTTLYAGVEQLLLTLAQRSIPFAIVTNIPSSFASRLIAHHRLEPATAVFYHDVRRAKPAPDMVLLAMQRLGVKPEVSIGVGDAAVDAAAFAGARVPAYCAAWNRNAERSAQWSALAEKPQDIESRL